MTLDMNASTKRIDEIIDSIGDLLVLAKHHQELASKSIDGIDKSAKNLDQKAQVLKDQIKQEIKDSVQQEIKDYLESSADVLLNKFKSTDQYAEQASERYKGAAQNYEETANAAITKLIRISLIVPLIAVLLGAFFLRSQIDSLSAQNHKLESIVKQISKSGSLPRNKNKVK